MKIDVHPLYEENGSIMAFYAKGTWSREEMVKGIRWYGWDNWDFSSDTKIESRYYRCIPEPPNSDSPFKYRLEPAQAGRGAFVATTVWL